MVLARIGSIMMGIAILMIGMKFLSFYFSGDWNSETVSRFIIEIFTIGVEASIPLEVVLIQTFGTFGIVLVLIDGFISRLE